MVLELFGVGLDIVFMEFIVHVNQFINLFIGEYLHWHHFTHHDVAALSELGVGVECGGVHDEGEEHIVDYNEAGLEVFIFKGVSAFLTFLNI